MDKVLMLTQLIDYYTAGNKSKFAVMLGVSPQTISAWISRATFDSEAIYAHCRGVSADWLLSGNGPMLSSGHINQAVSNGDSSIAVNNNTGSINSTSFDERIKLLEKLLDEKERTIQLLLSRDK